ncbi:MAG: hypothetical protein ACTSWN_05115 [Promethearchaeota archaeon]
MSGINNKLLDKLYDELPDNVKNHLNNATESIISCKRGGGKIIVVTGSGPNIHEGVTTLIAELIHQDIVDGVLTSSAVIAHELAGSLDMVKRVDGSLLGFSLQDEKTMLCLGKGRYFLPRGGIFEFTVMDDSDLEIIEKDYPLNRDLIKHGRNLEGKTIIKVAGNMAYPMGPRTELLASRILKVCSEKHEPLEYLGGAGADPMTMIGAGWAKNVPVLVTIPQMIGGGNVGICIGDSIPIRERCSRIAKMLSKADIVIESALALAQEIHDGPFETYTGHGIWAGELNGEVFTLRGKKLIRIDLDPNLELVWKKEREASKVQTAIDDGKPKTKLLNVPFRMEMSGFARLEGSIPIVGDIGVVWPLIARSIAEELGIDLRFISYPQDTKDGQKMRKSIVHEVKFFNLQDFMEKMKLNG